MNAEAKKWGCPDWRDAHAYKTTLLHATWQWKWEFLRRLPEYREFFVSVSEREKHDSSYVNSIEEYFDYKWHFAEFGLVDMVNPKTTPNECPFHSFGGTQVLFEDAFELMKNFHEGESLGMGRLRYLYRTILSFLQLEGITDDVDSSERLKKIVSLRFDLSKPLNPQLKTAKLTLQTEAEHLEAKFPKPKLSFSVRKDWPRHLRVIDAEDQGASDKEIYDQFLKELQDEIERYDEFSDTKQPLVLIHDWKKTARNTMEKASRFL
jgi:hypothetical protein